MQLYHIKLSDGNILAARATGATTGLRLPRKRAAEVNAPILMLAGRNADHADHRKNVRRRHSTIRIMTHVATHEAARIPQALNRSWKDRLMSRSMHWRRAESQSMRIHSRSLRRKRRGRGQ